MVSEGHTLPQLAHVVGQSGAIRLVMTIATIANGAATVTRAQDHISMVGRKTETPYSWYHPGPSAHVFGGLSKPRDGRETVQSSVFDVAALLMCNPARRYACVVGFASFYCPAK